MKINKKKLNKIVNILLPQIYLFDLIYHFLRFILINKRIPKPHSYLLNDFLFYIKINPKISKGDYHYCSDKLNVKKYLKKKIKKKNILQNISIILNNFDISQYNLKKNQIIKPAHMSGMIIFTNKLNNLSEIKKIMNKWLDTDFYSLYRESNYKNLKKRVMIETDLSHNSAVSDLKVFCYKGKIKFFQIDTDRFSVHKRQFLDINWNIIDVQWQYEQLTKRFEKPIFFEEIIESCNIIATDFEFVRIDFLITKDKFFCNELTFVPEKAEGKFKSLSEEKKLSKYLFG